MKDNIKRHIKRGGLHMDNERIKEIIKSMIDKIQDSKKLWQIYTVIKNL